MIHKSTRALFLAVNGLYIIYFIILMIWLKESIITDVYKKPVILSDQVIAIIQITMSALSLVIFIGLARVLTAYKEKLWIITSVWAYLILQLYFNLLSVLNIYHMPLPHLFYNYTMYVNYAILLYMVISIQFVQNSLIKNYYRWFGIMVFISMLLIYCTPVLYNKYKIIWVLINPGILKIIPFFISLFLYVKLLKSAPFKLPA